MPPTLCDEAIVLKTYDVGEADRFCILLTQRHGRLAARAAGVRKLTSRRGPSLLSLQRVDVELCERSDHQYLISNASVLESFADVSSDLAAFSAAEQATELLLHFIHDGEVVESAYHLTCEFLRGCRQSFHSTLLPAFTMRLLALLGSLPSLRTSVHSHAPLRGSAPIAYSPAMNGFCLASEDPSAQPIDPALHTLLVQSMTLPIDVLTPSPSSLERQFTALVSLLLRDQLGVTLKAAPLALAIACGSTPT